MEVEKTMRSSFLVKLWMLILFVFGRSRSFLKIRLLLANQIYSLPESATGGLHEKSKSGVANNAKEVVKICRMPGQGNTVNLLNLFFTLAVMAIFLLACTSKPDGSVGTSKQDDWSVELREEEHKTIKHPDKKTYAKILSDGLQVSFQSDQVHFPSYTFAHKEFQLGEPVFLSSPGSKDLLPMRVVLIKRSNDPKDYHVYKIEWLDKAPAISSGTRIIRY